jgi:segregation and condensation protein B
MSTTETDLSLDQDHAESLIPSSDAAAPVIDLKQALRLIEGALLAAQEPLGASQLRKLFDEEIPSEVLRRLLDELRETWNDRGLILVQVASGWRFQTRPDVQARLARLHPERPPRYSRAVMETLAIIAYRQPVTRGDIEDIRGVAVSTQILRALEARGWIDVIGHREVPGRPELFGTTRRMLDDLGLRSLQELPPLADLEADPQSFPVLEDALGSLETESVAEPSKAEETDSIPHQSENTMNEESLYGE